MEAPSSWHPISMICRIEKWEHLPLASRASDSICPSPWLRVLSSPAAVTEVLRVVCHFLKQEHRWADELRVNVPSMK